tara:strand:- start:128 stop:337 length:210 start_codon:yes stop_codon:yes gene_type:complete
MARGDVIVMVFFRIEISVYLRELVSLMQPLLRLTQTNSDWLFLDEWKVNSHILEIISKETQTQINLIFQ